MMKNFRLLLTDFPWPDLELENSILSPHGVELVVAPDDREKRLVNLAQNVDAIATCWAKVTRPVIEAATRCKIICRMGIGLDNIDVQAATEKNILVTNVPDYCIAEVADHTLGLILALKRNIGFFHQQTKELKYDLKAASPMHRLSQLRLGLIGFGRTGRAVYERAKPFGFDLVASSISGNNYGTGCAMLPVSELIATSDIISLHVPLDNQTRHLLNRTSFARMRPGVCIVNTSRGGLIDQAALAEAIINGTVAHAGLDVFDPEPPQLSEAIFRQQNVIVTPHAAFVSEESLIELRSRVAEQILSVQRGERPAHVVNE